MSKKNIWLPFVNTPWKWRIVSSLLPPEQPVIKNRQHQEWIKIHSHFHSHREILVILKGHCLYGFKDLLYKCQPGTVFLFDHFEKHDLMYSPQTTNGIHAWLVIIHGRIFVKVIKLTNDRLGDTKKRLLFQVSDVELILNRCWSELSSQTNIPIPLRRVKIITALAAVLIFIAEQDFCTTSSNKKYDQREEIVISIQKYIETTAGKDINLDNIVEITGYSKFHFLRLFKKYTGQTMYHFIHISRIKKVKSMLISGYRKKEIAYKLGFSGPIAFSHWCKQHL